jgi:hypothetical protein
VPVERGPEFCAVVGLDHVDPEWRPLKHVVDEPGSRSSGSAPGRGAAPAAGAVVDGGELVELAPGAGRRGTVGGG